ncbi:PREDICTED: short-chain collagen C4-like [Amphimedon queenslandica]|uniref:Uncharacterized protein n=1 Tax=Amphimedon queenslandica TaxID=400682 RepID=A0A1X7VPC9_AMPQE|nr:PREDICTED: short-chain collagen C4-like [Amphimedon queenslandica]|eukprot:XP_019863094.1 PREDICTED: short-chain collagen C4-like [Amphimedon queenslandica]
MKVFLSLAALMLVLGMAHSQWDKETEFDELNNAELAPQGEKEVETKENEVGTKEQEEMQLEDTDMQDISKEVSEEGDNVNAENVIVHLTRGKKLVLVIDPDNYYNGASGAGTTYTRWGKASCRRGAQLVYAGQVGGGFYTQRGNGAKYMCMPYDPAYLSTVPPVSASYIYGSEYESSNRIFAKKVHDFAVPCAVCRAIRRTTTITIPAKPTCPRGWTREYFGYMMSSYFNHAQQVDPVCVDVNADAVAGSQGNQNGILLYFMRVICRANSIPCGRYRNNLAITCAVCSR